MKRLVYGMSMKKSELADWIDNHTFQVMVSLAQLYLFPSGNRVHWRKEVWEKFSRVYTLKHNRKLPSAQFILDSSWLRNSHNVQNALQYAIDKEDQYQSKADWNFDDFYLICQDYFIFVADKLSQNETLMLSDVKAELDRLGLYDI